MPKAVPVMLPSIQFSKKKDAKNFFKAIRDRYSDGVTLENMDAQHLSELLAMHPDCVEKTGVGVKRIYCDVSEEGTRCFFIERTDGTNIDFSSNWIVDSLKNNDRAL